MKGTRRWIRFLLAACLALCLVPLKAQAATEVASGTCGPNLTWQLEAGVLSIRGEGRMYDYKISNTYGNITPWYYLCDDIQRVVIGDGVTSIGEYAFCDCSNLVSISIPQSLDYIGFYAFNKCYSLTDIYVSDLLTWINIQKDGSYNSYPLSCNDKEKKLYIDGELATHISIPDNTIAITNMAFRNCSSILAVDIPSCTTIIGAEAFGGCSNLMDVTLNNGLLTIGDAAFSGCSKLSNIGIPNTVISIGKYAFDNCGSLDSVNIPHSVTDIGYNAFTKCSRLNNVILGDGVTKVERYTFQFCTELKSVCLGSGVTSIDIGAFNGCRNLKQIIIPESITDIASSAFYLITLENIYYGGTVGQWENLGESRPNSKYVHYLCTEPANHWIQDNKEPTCVDNGYSRDICACGLIRNEVLQNATGIHSFVNGSCEYCNQAESIPGDLDGDGLVSDTDVEYLLWYTLFPDLYPITTNADYDKDGVVSDTDVEYLLWHTLFPDLYPLG